MNSMTFISAGSDPSGRSSRDCLWRAVQCLRRLALQPAPSVRETDHVLPPCADMVRAGRAFRAFLMVAWPALGARAPYLAQPGNPYLTKDERRLLQAIVAAQADNHWVLDNYLYPIALDRKARSHLAEAIRHVAAALEAAGFLLTVLPRSVPAAALRVAFAHGFALDEIDVTWPARLAD